MTRQAKPDLLPRCRSPFLYLTGRISKSTEAAHSGASDPSTGRIQPGGRHEIAWGESANPRFPAPQQHPSPGGAAYDTSSTFEKMCRPYGAGEFRVRSPGVRRPHPRLPHAALRAGPCWLEGLRLRCTCPPAIAPGNAVPKEPHPTFFASPGDSRPSLRLYIDERP